MLLVFGEGKIGIGRASSILEKGISDLVILDPERGTGEVGKHVPAIEGKVEPLNLNAVILQFKNPESVQALIGELETVKASLTKARERGITLKDFEIPILLGAKEE